MHREHDNKGLVVLVGAGPGEPQLVSQAAIEWLSRADTVLYDRLAPPQLLQLASPQAELICVGKAPDAAATSQDRINSMLVEKCRAGRLVVRLKGGDPFIFGRGGEEADALADAGVPFRVVPGITAAQAAAAYAGIPLTDRRAAASVAFVTGRQDPAKAESAIDYDALARIDTVVFYMSVGNLPRTAEKLMQAGRAGPTPAAVIERASTPRQRTIVATLETLAARAATAGIEPPAIVIVGDVAAMHDRLAWFERLPLFGRTVLLTRPAGQASQLGRLLTAHGADVIAAPAIEIAPPQSYKELDAATGRLDQFDWLVLTSANGVRFFFARLTELGKDARALGGVKIAAIGPATTEALQQRSVRPDLMPETYTTADLADALISAGVAEKKLLLARADIAAPNLPEKLRAAGADVTDLLAYRTVRPAALPAGAVDALKAGRVDWIAFTSASTVDNFVSLAAEARLDLAGAKFAAIGPVTAAALARHSLAATVTAEPHTIDALAAEILATAARR